MQSIERAFTLLEILADHGGSSSLSELSAVSGLPLPTIHRLIRTLAALGYVAQEPSRRYALAPKLIRLGEASSAMVHRRARPLLAGLVDELGESSNLAMLDGDQMVYVAQEQSRHSMRMFTEVGRRVLPHCTAVGKAVLATMPAHGVSALLGRTGMPRYTETTITDRGAFLEELATIAARGFAIDEGEHEVGVRCVAVAVPDSPARLALSVSGPATRMTEELIARAVPLLTNAASDLSRALTQA